MRFTVDADGDIAVELGDGEAAYAEFAAWLKLGVNYSPMRCLDALQMADDVLTGQSDVETFTAEAHTTTFTRDKVTVRHQFLDRGAVVPLKYAVERIEEWWGLIAYRAPKAGTTQPYRPDLPFWEAQLVLWEETWERRHPYRGRLGIPE
ncbi:hypothetical protein AB0I28_35485 [Phytomonospora sp. NPDC050363]|uniref:hypothetical protein n=1 Tax=Phytomonospora sp. NPDC050363 TaxID=3155642 RepID=UPI0033E2D6B4